MLNKPKVAFRKKDIQQAIDKFSFGKHYISSNLFLPQVVLI